jgi:alkylation response protein AidB-like acyl-CoA dehydrogenase
MFDDNENQQDLRALTRELLDDQAGEVAVRALMATEDGYDAAFWSVLAEAGLLGLAVDEQHGGSACGLTEVGIVAEELGARVVCSPWLATMSAVSALTAADDDVAIAAHLPGIVAGETIATLAVGEGRLPIELTELTTVAQTAGSGWTVTGNKRFVIDGASADLFLVLAATDAGPTLLAVRSPQPEIDVTRLSTMDLTRKLADVHFANAAAELVGAPGAGWRAVQQAHDQALTLLAMEQVGGAARALQDTVAYARVRFQFGRPIGAFQAIKHRCADMLVDVETARSAARYALWSADQDTDDLPIAARIAASACSEAYASVAAAMIQVHGGIGFTWEHPTHLYFKRAHGSRVLFGSPSAHRAALAELLDIRSSKE